MRPFLAAAMLAPLSLSGCGSSPAATFLTLTPTPPVTVNAYRGPPLRVPFLRVPVTLDRPEFVQQVANTVIVSDFDRWAAPLGRLARDTLIQNLQARLPAGKVLPPDAGATVPEVRVEATILSFTTVDGQAVLTLSYRIVPAQPAASTSVTASPRPVTLRAPLAADDAVSQAGAWSVLLGQLSDRIVGDVTTG